MDHSGENSEAASQEASRSTTQRTKSSEMDFQDKMPMTALQRWVMALAVLIPFLGISFGGTRHPAILSSLIVLTGLLVIIRPIQARIHRVWIGLGILFLLLNLLPLLPIFPDAWRSLNLHLYRVLQLAPPNSLALQPWVTLEQWVGLTACVVWFWWCLGQNFTESQRRFALKMIGAYTAILAVIAICLKLIHYKFSLWSIHWDLDYFGPFPNRNHFSALLAFGTIALLSISYELYRRKKKSALYFILAVIPTFAAILVNNSRSGMVLFFTGIILWIIAGGLKKHGLKRITLMLSALFTAAILFMIFGKHLIDRFTNQGSFIETLATEKRLLVYSDSLSLLMKSPIFGVGLGNFEPAYGVFKSMEHPVYRTLHPESDWLWIGIESGIPAMLVALCIFGLIIKRSNFFVKTSSRKNGRRRIRNTFCIGVMLFCIHAIFDTPLHHLGIAMLLALLAALALPQRRTDDALPHRSLMKYALPLAGTVVLISGAIYWLNANQQLKFPSTASYHRDVANSIVANHKKDYASSESHLRSALKFKPLQWDLYFRVAQTLLNRRTAPQQAALHFARARVLEKQHIDMCFQEGDAWLASYPEMSLPAWREIINRNPNSAPLNYAYILDRLRKFPSLREQVRNFANTPKLKLVYLLSSNDDEFKRHLEDFKDSKEWFSALSSQDKYALFEAWYRRGNRSQLLARLKSNAELKQDGWPFLSDDLAQNGEFQKAYELAMDYIVPPYSSAAPMDLSVADAKRKFLANPNDIIQGYYYHEALNRDRQYYQALSVLKDLETLPDRPNKILYDLAKAYAKLQDYPKAYQTLMDYFKVSKGVKN